MMFSSEMPSSNAITTISEVFEHCAERSFFFNFKFYYFTTVLLKEDGSLKELAKLSPLRPNKMIPCQPLFAPIIIRKCGVIGSFTIQIAFTLIEDPRTSPGPLIVIHPYGVYNTPKFSFADVVIELFLVPSPISNGSDECAAFRMGLQKCVFFLDSPDINPVFVHDANLTFSPPFAGGGCFCKMLLYVRLDLF